MVNCSIINCHHGNDKRRADHKKGVRFFSIPKVMKHLCDKTRELSSTRRALWLSRIKREDLQESDVKAHTKVCSAHFITGNPSALFDDVNPDWAPSQNLGYDSSIPQKAQKAMLLYKRTKERNLGKPLVTPSTTPQSREPAAVPENEASVDQHFGPEIHCESGVTASNNQQDPVNETSVDQQLGLEIHCESGATASDNPQDPHSVANDANFENCPRTEGATKSGILTDSAPQNIDTPTTEAALAALQGKCIDVTKNYASVCKRAQLLRDQVTNLEVDKSELQAALLSAEKDAEILRARVKEMEEFIKSQHQKIEEDALRHKEFQEKLEEYEKELEELRREVMKAKQLTFTDLETFSSDEEKVKFYTGLPSYSVFNVLVNGIVSYFNEQSIDLSRHALAPWQCVLLTLMRLRLSLTLQDLACRFGVHKATACRVFEKYIDVMHVTIYPALVRWPSRETLWKTMPREFREAYGNSVAVIIDCFEVFTDKPSSLESRAIIWSNYKHHHTVKILIGISPTGAVTFVSSGWGARVSDKHLVEESGLYQFLLPYDVVMADRGFDIAEHLAMYGAKLLIPAFTRGQDQLSSHDIALTRKIANLRIHVERVIGLVRRKFRILKSILPIDLLMKKTNEDFAPIDKIVRVCCALVNMCPSIVVHPETHEEVS